MANARKKARGVKTTAVARSADAITQPALCLERRRYETSTDSSGPGVSLVLSLDSLDYQGGLMDRLKIAVAMIAFIAFIVAALEALSFWARYVRK